MSKPYDAYDADRPLMLRCACGQDHAPGEHAQALAASEEELSRNFMEASLVKALFPVDSVRRGFLKAVGANTARAAIASVLPISALQAIAQERGALEKKDLKIGFIAITCATPLIMADPLGFYKQQGLNVQLNKTAGWALIRDKMLNKEHDASHFLSPMPLAISMGLGSTQVPMNVATIQNTNGQAITLHVKHKDKRDPKSWKGFKFAVPFEYSMHNFLLRYYLAEHGVNPDTDVQIRVTPPPEMVANLRAGNIDGFLGPDPFNQRAVYDEVGFIHILSKEIWDGHPCCAVAAAESWITRNPNTFMAFYRAIVAAGLHVSDERNRAGMAKVLAQPQYLNAPEVVIDQVITGRYADGLGAIKEDARRVDYRPFPQYAAAVWLMTQLRRWKMLREDIDYKALAGKVMLATDAARILKEDGVEPPPIAFGKEQILGREFDSAKPEEYLASLQKT